VQLRADHRHIEERFSKYYTEDNEARWSHLIETALLSLKVHMALEEEIFYPAFVLASSQVERCPNAMVEHTKAKRIIAELEYADPGDNHYERKIAVLWSLAKSHMTAQETRGGMLDPKLLTRMDLLELGQQITLRREELLEMFSQRCRNT
jgi:hypothetical protein